MTDNFERYNHLINLNGGLPDNNEHGNLDKYYVIELMRRGKDNPDLPAANYHFRNYYIYSWRDLDKYEREIKDICDLLNLRAYCSVNYKLMSQVALDTMAESARRIAAHDYKKFYSIFESCSGKYVDRSNARWVVDIDEYGDISKESFFQPYMDVIKDGENMKFAVNSKGKIVPVKEIGWGSPDEKPTHLCLQFVSSYGTAYVGAVGTTLWLDNVKLVY